MGMSFGTNAIHIELRQKNGNLTIIFTHRPPLFILKLRVKDSLCDLSSIFRLNQNVKYLKCHYVIFNG